MANAEKPVSGKSNANTLAYVSFFVAALSLATSMYQGYLNTRFVDIVQSNVARGETARVCKDLIDAFFQIKFTATVLASTVAREKDANAPAVISASAAAQNAVSRFSAYGTYLANFQGEKKREEYTVLSRELERIVGTAQQMPPTDAAKLFEKADGLFGGMNDDCVRSATERF